MSLANPVAPQARPTVPPTASHAAKSAAVFPGQGSQGPCMGEPWRRSPQWQLIRAAEEQLDRDLSTMLLDPQRPPTTVPQTHLAVVLCSLMAWSAARPRLAPTLVAGHSLGLVAALHAAGVLTAHGAVRVAAIRAEITERVAAVRPGAMTAILGGTELARAACEHFECWIANDNSPEQSVISGTPAALVRAEAEAWRLGARDVVRLKIAGAFHSPLMHPAVAEFEYALREVGFARARIPVLHNAAVHAPGRATPWPRILADDLIRPVRWRETQLLARRLGVTAIVQVGYGRTLTGLAKRTLPGVRLYNADTPAAIESIADALTLSTNSRRTR